MIAWSEYRPLELVVQFAEDAENARRADQDRGVVDDVAVQAALKARFSPTKLSGQPVKVSGTINYKFALAQ